MSDVMMKALQLQVESLTRQVETLGPENERVRKLLTEFDQRHDADQARIRELEAELAALREVRALTNELLTLLSRLGPIDQSHCRYHNKWYRVDDVVNDLRTALELAALREARGVRVKPLVWQRQTYNSPDQVGHHASVYSIYESAETGNCVASSGAPYFWGPEHTDNLEAAKAAAQADYERRILAAIEPAPVTPAEAASQEWFCGGCGQTDPIKRCIGCFHEMPRALADAGEAG